nr:SDR family NAD(P)-dependent oxidoreductase [Oceanococcus sp. HetDA_MAG_MS8]
MRILITGATGVLGRALCLELVRRDPQVELIAMGRREDKLAALDDAVQEAGGQAPILVPLDFSKANPAHITELRQALEDQGLDALVLCAATHTGLHPLDHLKPADVDTILKVNLHAPIWLLHQFLPLLKQAAHGRVLGVSDEVGRSGKAFWGAYGIAKAGLDTLLEQVAAEAEQSLEVRRVVPPALPSPIRGLVYPGEDPRTLANPAQVCQPWAEWLLSPKEGTPAEVR